MRCDHRRHSAERLDAILRAAERGTLRRSLGAFELVVLGVGSVISTGIFVLIAESAQKAGSGMLVAFAIAGVVCALAGLCYAEVAGILPASGSAYTFANAVFGEFAGWLVGWALIAEYLIAAHGDEVGKLPGFKCADAVLPAKHFRSVCRHRAQYVKRRHARALQRREHHRSGLAPRFPSIEPAHVGTGRKLNS